MHQPFALVLGLLALAACRGTSDARNSTHAAENPVAQMSPEEFGERMMALAAVGPEHERLARLVGTWDAEVSSRFDPSGEWSKSQITVTTRAMLGGRFILQELDGQMMGMPFQGMALLGYDRLQGCYTSSWRDSLSTWEVHSTGEAVSDSVIEFRGQMVDFITPAGRAFRTRETMIDDDHWGSEMWDTIEGQEVLVMRVEATRRSR